MKKLMFVILAAIFALPIVGFSQVDCSNFLADRKAEPPYKINSMSKSAVCVSGHKYEFVVPLQKGYEYRIIFFASSVFNNKINFKIVDLNTGETVLDLPGESETNDKGTAALASYYDEKLNTEVHPYFDFIPQTTTNFKIIIDVEPQEDLIKGCVAVMILDKESEEGGF